MIDSKKNKIDMPKGPNIMNLVQIAFLICYNVFIYKIVMVKVASFEAMHVAWLEHYFSKWGNKSEEVFFIVLPPDQGNFFLY